ncbi:MAG: hypothetical protein AAGD10_19960 [Myxococcota bacterium]
MSELKAILLADGVRPKVLADARRLVESEVQAKGGISGLAIKAGYKAVQSVKPTLVPDALNNLLDRFVERLEPIFAQWQSGDGNQTFESYMVGRKREVANALLGVTDDRARSSSGVVKKTYEKLRPQGEKNVEAAVPGLASLIQKYL